MDDVELKRGELAPVHSILAGGSTPVTQQNRDDIRRAEEQEEKQLFTEIMGNPMLQAKFPAKYAQAINYFQHGQAPMGTMWSDYQGPPTQAAQEAIDAKQAPQGEEGMAIQTRHAEVLGNHRLSNSSQELQDALDWAKGRTTPPAPAAAPSPSHLPLGGWDRYMEIIQDPKKAQSEDERRQAIAWAEERNIEVPLFDIKAPPGEFQHGIPMAPVPPPPPAPPTSGDYTRQAAWHMDQQGRKKEQLAKKMAGKGGYYSTQIKAYEDYSTARHTLKQAMEKDLKTLGREARYPGIVGGSDEIEDLERDIERAKKVNDDPLYYGRRLSQEEMEQIVATGASAKVQLSRGREVDQFRAFGSFGSKIMAIAAMGGSSLGSGDNAAYKMIMKTIDRDVEIQKDAFKAARGAPGERMSQYEKAMSVLKDERAVDLYVSSMKWGQASALIKAQAESLGNYASADKLRAQARKAEEEQVRLQAEALEASIKAIQKAELEERKVLAAESRAASLERATATKEVTESRKKVEGEWRHERGEEKLDLGWASLDEKEHYHNASTALKRELGLLDNQYDRDLLILRSQNADLDYEKFQESKDKTKLDQDYRERALLLGKTEFQQTLGFKEDQLESTTDKWQAADTLGRDRLNQDIIEHQNMSANEVAQMASRKGLLDEKTAKRLQDQANRHELTEMESRTLENLKKKMALKIRGFEELSAAQELQQENMVAQRTAAAEKVAVKHALDERAQVTREGKLVYLTKKQEDNLKLKERGFGMKERRWNFERAVEEKGVYIPGWKFVGDRDMAASRTAGVTEKVRDKVAKASNMFAAIERGIEFSEDEGVVLFPGATKGELMQVKGDIMNQMRMDHGFGVIAHLFEQQRLEQLTGDIGGIWEETTGKVAGGLKERLAFGQEQLDIWMKDYGYVHDSGGGGPRLAFPSTYVVPGPGDTAEGAPAEAEDDDVFDIGN